MSGKFMQTADLIAAKRETEIFNSMLKRKVINSPETIVRTHHIVCGCGQPGCVFLSHTRKDTIKTVQ